MSPTTTISAAHNTSFPAALNSQEADPSQMIAAMNKTASSTSALFEEAWGAYESQREEMASAIERLGEANEKLQTSLAKIEAKYHELQLLHERQIHTLHQRIQRLSPQAEAMNKENFQSSEAIVHRQEQRIIYERAWQCRWVLEARNGNYAHPPNYGFPGTAPQQLYPLLLAKLDPENQVRFHASTHSQQFDLDSRADAASIQHRSSDLNGEIQDLKALVNQMMSDVEPLANTFSN